MPGPYDDLVNYAPPEDDPGWVSTLANKAVFAPLQWIGESLGKPQQALYGLLDGDVSALANLIPFSDTLGITGHNPGEGLINTPRRSGQDMLKNFGLIDSEDTWGNWGAGLATDLLTDPMNFLTFGTGALTKGGQAAKKLGTLEPSLLGRIQKGQGGFVGLKSTPWYMDLLGAKGEPLGVLGGQNSLGGWGEKAARGLENLDDAATRWTVPGTNVSPLAKAKAMFAPFRGFTGTPEYVQTAGRQLEGDTSRLLAEGTGRAMPFAMEQSNALNALAQTGMKLEDAEYALWRAGTSASETGETLLLPNLTGQQAQILQDFGTKAQQSRGLYDVEKAGVEATGGAVPDVSLPWRDYEARKVRGYSNKMRGQQMERTDVDKFLPYGTAQFEEYARNPNFAGVGVNKTPGVPWNQAAVDAQVAGNAAAIAQDISSGVQQRFGHLLQGGKPVGPVSPELMELLQYADAGKALKPAGEIAAHLSKLDSSAGHFATDLATNRISYAQNLARQGATNLTALQTFANEAVDVNSALTSASKTSGILTLPQAMEKAGLSESGSGELLSRLQALGKNAPLDQMGVTPELTEALKREIGGPKTAPPGPFSKLASAFRYGVTIPFPANLTRNWADTLLQQGMAGQGVGKGLGTAVDYFRRALTDPAKHATAQKAFEAGFQHGLFDDQLRGLLGVEGMTKGGERALNMNPTQAAKSRTASLGEQFGPVKDAAINATGIKGKITEPVKEYLKAMEGSHQFQNNATRLQQMMNLMEEGYAPSAAAEKVKTTQLDYCVDEETEALTGRGWKKWHEITSDDTFLTIDPETMEVHWSFAEKINVFDHDGPMNLWSSTMFNAMTTDNHRWLCLGSGVRGGWPRMARNARHFDTTASLNKKTKRIVLAGGKYYSQDAVHDDRLVELIAWYLTEGWSCGKRFGIMVAQSMRHNPDYVERIRRIVEWCKGNGWTATECKIKDNGWGDIASFYFGKGIGDKVRELCPDKQVDVEFLASLTTEQLELFVQTLVDGDGHRSKRGETKITQKCDQRTAMFQAAAVMAGYRTRTRKSNNGCNVISLYKSTEVYAKKGLKKERVHYRGKTWCPTTSDGTWLARRNGYAYWTGNSRLSSFERDTARTWAPFYNYSRQNLGRTASLLQEDPGKLGALMALANSGRTDGEYVPPYVSGGAAVPLPGAPEGMKRYISSFGLPMEDEAIGALSALLGGRASESARRAASASNPLAKTFYELATGTQVFSGRPLEDLRPSGTLASLMGDNAVSRFLSQAVQGTPGARILSTGDRLLDSPNKGALSTLLNLGTGVRVTDIDQKLATEVAARDALRDLLKQSGQFKSRESVYLDKRKVPDPSQLPPELQALMEQYRAMERMSQAAAKERSAGR